MTILRLRLSHSATEAPLEDGGSEVTRPPQTTPEEREGSDLFIIS